MPDPTPPPYTGPGAIVDLRGYATLADAAVPMRRVLAGRLVGVTNADGQRIGPARENDADEHYTVYGEPVG